MQRGTKHTEEAKKLMSEKRKGKSGNHNCPHTVEARQKMSLSHKGKHWYLDEATGKRIYF